MKDISPLRSQEVSEFSEAADFSPQKEEAHLRDYWKIIVKYRSLIIIIFVVVVGFGAWIISQATPTYTSTAIIKIEPQGPQYLRGIEEVLKLENNSEYYSTQHELMRSRALAAKVIMELGLESDHTFTSAPIISPDPMRWLNSKFTATLQSLVNYVEYVAKIFSRSSGRRAEISTPPKVPSAREESISPQQNAKPLVRPWLIGRYLGFLRVDPMRGTRLVRIAFTTPDPYLSQKLVNAHATAFVRMNLETRFEVTKEARIYLDKKLAELKSKVEESEAELDAFRKSHDLLSMDRGENLIVDRMLAVNGNLTSARMRRIDLESVLQMVRSKNLFDLSEVMTNGTIQGYRGAIESLTSEQVKLSTVFKPDHPKMIELSTRIADTRQRMKLAIDEVVRRIETDYASAKNREASLEAEAGRQRQAAIDLKGLGVKYSVLQGDAEQNRRLYNSVLTRLNETTITNDMPVSNMQVTELADTPGGLSSGGQQMKQLMTTASAALFLGLALAFCLSYFDSTFSTPNDVSRFLYLPALGVVPELRSLRYRPQGYFQFPKHPITNLVTFLRTRYGDTLSKDLMVSSEPSSILSESYRSIRTALLFSQAESPPQTVLFTSPGPAEGKTVTVLNLAIALAQSGKSVLVIDADMRRGRCHRVLHRSNDRGLSNVLSGNLTLDESVQDTTVPGLFVLTRGMVPPNPPDLLGSSKMREVLDLLRNRFEFILIDAPPVIGVTDAGVLSSICQGVVLVVHSKKTSRFSARQAVQSLESVRGHILGVVLNGINIRDPDYASYRYYYSSYYASVNPESENPTETREFLIEDPPDRTTETELASVSDGSPQIVSQQLFDQIITNLVEAAGPLAPLIVRDHVDLLGECLESFPKDRLTDLIDNLCEEIPDDKLKTSFRKSIAQYL